MDEMLSYMSHLILNGGYFEARRKRQFNCHPLDCHISRRHGSWTLNGILMNFIPSQKDSFACFKSFVPANFDLFRVRRGICLLQIWIIVAERSRRMLVSLGLEIPLRGGMNSFHCYQGGGPFLRKMKLRSFARSILNMDAMHSWEFT
jgi:hypothetical protein